MFNKSLIFIIINSIVLLLVCDFLFGTKILKMINEPTKIIETKPTDKNDIFDYNFKKNLDKNFFYSKFEYRVCTNSLSLRSDCSKDKEMIEKDFDILFIGDSFTEGVGLDYNDTFVGIFENSLKLNIGNLGVSSYSPYNYYKKIKYYIDELKINTKEVIVFLDLSDAENDFNRFIKENKLSSLQRNDKVETQDNLNLKLRLRKMFPLIYEGLFFLKHYKLPNPKYRYHPNYSLSAWPYTKVNYDLNKALDLNKIYMTKLYEYLREKNIDLSVAVYPYPNTLIYDNLNSNYVSLWKNFCLEKCKNFFNFFPLFFENKNKLDFKEALEKVSLYYLDGDMHYNKLGNEKIANDLINFFKNNTLISN